MLCLEELGYNNWVLKTVRNIRYLENETKNRRPEALRRAAVKVKQASLQKMAAGVDQVARFSEKCKDLSLSPLAPVREIPTNQKAYQLTLRVPRRRPCTLFFRSAHLCVLLFDRKINDSWIADIRI
jgi:hypothetical protein